MTAAVAIVNLLLGVAYCGYGVMTVIEMRRDWSTFGFSHFGAAWIFMAFTCGPHHLAHGLHLALEGRQGGALDLWSVVVGLPVGVLWLWMRVEAFLGGRGDRFVSGTPRWLQFMPVLAAGHLALVVGVAVASGDGFEIQPVIVANALLVGIYMAIGWVILRTQLANREPMGGWSMSGLCLSGIFPTCALMHAVWAIYAVRDVYHSDVHGLVIDWLSVPAGIYFLCVVWQLYRDALQDWNQGPEAVLPAPTEEITPVV